jgi:hypothetical protein
MTHQIPAIAAVLAMMPGSVNAALCAIRVVPFAATGYSGAYVKPSMSGRNRRVRAGALAQALCQHMREQYGCGCQQYEFENNECGKYAEQ